MSADWNVFKANHPDYRDFFEKQVCYILFCRENNIRNGIFRYKNQTGIETEPIEIDGELIGWQAKFFENEIDKKQIKESIQNAKKKNPKLAKIYLYSNKEFGENPEKNQKKPKKLIEIEAFAETINVKIVWRLRSHIELQLSWPENKYLAEEFSILSKTTNDSIEELFMHTENSLKQIHTDISFNRQRIKINREALYNELIDSIKNPSVVVISGEGGTGKTALIKELYLKNVGIPMFVFKANELNKAYINKLFNEYGANFSLACFIDYFKNISKKVVVIDSAEKISDIQNQEPLKEFVSALFAKNWSVIFTTRYKYFDDLVFAISTLWTETFKKIDVEKLKEKELRNISTTYNFDLPADKKLLQLIEIPFYLNEYLQNYKEAKGESVAEFKKLLWARKIQGTCIPSQSKLKREKCFIEISVKRANDLSFVVEDIECEDDIIKSLEDDGIIGLDKQQSGYFITQDVYEEWALEKYIEKSFNKSANVQEFFNIIGTSLAIRRTFRKWISENIKNNANRVTPIINSVKTRSVPQPWKDEIIVSIQLTAYSENFYNEFKDEILSNAELLQRIIFLTRTACKEVDNRLLKMLRIKPDKSLQLEYLMTQPKGEGWKALIKFLHQNREILNLNTNIIIGLLQDWLSKNKEGKTTRYCGLLAIYLLEREYKKVGKDKDFYIDSNKETNLSKAILLSTSEIKKELQSIFDEILQGDNYTRRSKYSELVHLTLTSLLDFQMIVKVLPEKVIELADKLWYDVPNKRDSYLYYSSPMDQERSFCLTSFCELEYFPQSAFQTPIYFLLKVKPLQTLQFIVKFVNKTIECYANSEYKNEVKIVDVHIDRKVVKQYISGRLWSMYRGTSFTSPYLLQSIHMALEKWLLEITKAEEIESICKYLLKNSKSASITSVVISTVLANPIKLRNVALILFKTKEFFLFDTERMTEEMSARSLYSIGYGLGRDIIKKMYIEERLKTCEDEHRNWSLENLMLKLQMSKEKDDTEFEDMRGKIWEILDDYYVKLPDKKHENDEDKMWMLCLARMDLRKQELVLKKLKNDTVIEFHPKIDSELQKYSEEAVKESLEYFKHSSLKLWSEFRFKNDKQGYTKEEYKKYEENPVLALNETKEIQTEMKNNGTEKFALFNRSIPIHTCMVLVRDFFEKLNKEQREFCKEIVFEYSDCFLSDNYTYQVGDGVETAISILPRMLQRYPSGKNEIKELITKILFCGKYKIVNLLISVISSSLWQIDRKFAQSLFLGFIYLEPKYQNIFKELKRKRVSKKIHSRVSNGKAYRLLVKQNKKTIENIINCSFNFFDATILPTLDEHILINALYLLPRSSNDEIHVTFVTELAKMFSQKLFLKDEKLSYELINSFLVKFAQFVLTSEQENIDKYIQPFVEGFRPSRYAKDIFGKFISAEDNLNQYCNFWYIWNKFYDKIITLSQEDCSNYYVEEILKNYLLAWPWWDKSAKEWHSLNDKNKSFYRKVLNDIGYCPIVLYSISKVLNDIGSRFIDDGIYWISDIIKMYEKNLSIKLKPNTVYYLELLLRRYILAKRQLIKTDKKIKEKEKVLVILNFLVNRGSSVAYLMREDIL